MEIVLICCPVSPLFYGIFSDNWKRLWRSQFLAYRFDIWYVGAVNIELQSTFSFFRYSCSDGSGNSVIVTISQSTFQWLVRTLAITFGIEDVKFAIQALLMSTYKRVPHCFRLFHRWIWQSCYGVSPTASLIGIFEYYPFYLNLYVWCHLTLQMKQVHTEF